jgi:tetratricopeptide (TPR) repeat protein
MSARAAHSNRRLAIAVFAVVGLALLAAYFTSRPDSPPSIIDQDEIDEPLRTVNPGYLGVEVCRECHEARVREYQGTRHAIACVSSAGIRSPGFDAGRGRLQTRDPGLRFEMSRTGDRFSILGVRTTAPPDEASYTLDLAYGTSGASDEMYFAWEEDRLLVHHIGWLYPSNDWGHAANALTARPALTRCLECHNTWLAHVPGSPNRYIRDEMILGVSCERCHGPGREHVDEHRRNPRSERKTILHPGQLDRERRIEVCTQCHSPSFHRKTPAMSYRPGEPLAEHFAYTANEHQEYDLVGNQIEYLRKSKCFQKSEMTCDTCHNPHRAQSHESASKDCRQCHEPEACREQPKLPQEVRADCAGCHTPRRVWMGALFHTANDRYVPVTLRSDHRIAVHPDATKTVLLNHYRTRADATSRAEADRLARELSAHWIVEADRRRSQNRPMGVNQALREAVRVDSRPETLKLLHEAVDRVHELDRLIESADDAVESDPKRAAEILRQVLKIRPDHAKSHGKLGTLEFRFGRREDAVRHLEAVSKFDPRDSFGLKYLASLAEVENRLSDAADLYARADRAEPFQPVIQHDWGRILMRLGRGPEAESRFRKVLEIDPRHVGAAEKLSAVLRERGDLDAARTFARRAIRWSEDRSVEAWVALADVERAAGRSDAERTALHRALHLAKAHPDRVDALTQRLRSIP